MAALHIIRNFKRYIHVAIDCLNNKTKCTENDFNYLQNDDYRKKILTV